MSIENRWATGAYPPNYQDQVNRAIGFSGLGMDMFARGRVEDTLDLLDQHAAMSARMTACLDIGCGIGVSHPLLLPHVGSLSGADVSAEAIAMARTANPDVEYRNQVDHRLPFADQSFDFCSTVCVMHHVPPKRWPSFVAEAWRVTRPGGVFAVYEHNPINPMTRWAVWRCPFDHDAVLLSAGRVSELLTRQGFEIVTRRYQFFIPLDRPWARRLERWLRWLPLGAQYVVCARRPKPGASTCMEDPA